MILDASPQPRLHGLRCMVLGSTTGIGRAAALALAEEGADVIVHGRSSDRAAAEVAERIRAMGRRSEILMADLADRSACDRLAEAAWNLWGGLDVWAQIAGADVLTGSNARMAIEAKLDMLWEVDVVSAFRLCRDIGRRMKSQGRGAIIAMGWDQAETGMEGDSGETFGLIKGAVHAFVRSLALSLAPQVRVNAVAPGWIKTEWGESASSSWQDRAIRETPLARWGRPEDVARVVRFLASPESEFLTGQIVRVNGGAVRS